MSIPEGISGDEIVELDFGIDRFTQPTIISNSNSPKLRGYPLVATVERAFWMLSEQEYCDATDFINSIDALNKERILQRRLLFQKHKKIIQFMKKNNKFNSSAFHESNLTKEEFVLRLEKRYQEHQAKIEQRS